MAHFILEDAETLETIYNSFQYYEKITTHDSSLSYCIFSIMAARLGLIEKAYEYYEITANLICKINTIILWMAYMLPISAAITWLLFMGSADSA